MSLSDPVTFLARWESHEAEYLGVRPVHAADGVARFTVDLPFGDERDDDPSFAACAVAFAVDVASLSALFARLDEAREHPNGTASMHLNLLETPDGPLTIEAQVAASRPAEAVVEVTGHADDGRLVVKGLLTFSIRQRPLGGEQ